MFTSNYHNRYIRNILDFHLTITHIFGHPSMGTCSSTSATNVQETQTGVSGQLAHTPVTDTVVSLRYGDIPPFLHDSSFYQALCGDDDDEIIIIPDRYYKRTHMVSDIADFTKMVEVMMFWGLDEIPLRVLEFCASTDFNVWAPVSSALPDSGKIHTALQNYRYRRHMIPASTSPEVLAAWTEVHPPESGYGKDAMRNAAKAGDLELIRYFSARGYPRSEMACTAATAGGHYDCLRFLVDSGCKVGKDSCHTAALCGHLACLRYLHNLTMCPWNNKTICEAAANHGHLDCLRYAHEHGGHLTPSITLTSHLSCLKYALENRCPIHPDACYYSLVSSPSLLKLRLLRQHGASWDERVCDRAVLRDVDYLKYAISHGCPYDSSSLLQYAAE